MILSYRKPSAHALAHKWFMVLCQALQLCWSNLKWGLLIMLLLHRPCSQRYLSRSMLLRLLLGRHLPLLSSFSISSAKADKLFIVLTTTLLSSSVSASCCVKISSPSSVFRTLDGVTVTRPSNIWSIHLFAIKVVQNQQSETIIILQSQFGEASKNSTVTNIYTWCLLNIVTHEREPSQNIGSPQ